MKGIREIKQRIRSIKNTAQITRAMQLVAASKMKRAQDHAVANRPYALLLAEITLSLLAQVEEVNHPLVNERPVRRRGILVIATEKGLCGPLNTNLFKHIAEIKEDAAYVALGRKASQFIARSGRELLAEFTLSDHVNFSEVRMPLEFMIQAYLDGKIDTLEVLFSSFINTLKQEPHLEKLLPLQGLAVQVAELRARLTKHAEIEPVQDAREMLFEPNAQVLLAEIPALFVKQEVYQMALEAKASEHSARMVAMKTATDNAKTLTEDLTLEYNKVRQASITQEILEIAASTASQSA